MPKIIYVGLDASYEDDNIFVEHCKNTETIIPVLLLMKTLETTIDMHNDKTCQTHHSNISYMSSVYCSWNKGCNLKLSHPCTFYAITHASDLFAHTDAAYSWYGSAELMKGFEIYLFCYC